MNSFSAEKTVSVRDAIKTHEAAKSFSATARGYGESDLQDAREGKFNRHNESFMDMIPTWSDRAVVSCEEDRARDRELELALQERGPICFDHEFASADEVLSGLMYTGRMVETLPATLVSNAAAFTVSTLKPVSTPQFIQLIVTGPFVSTHKSETAKQVSELHFVSTNTYATVLVGSELHLPRSLAAVMDGQVVLHRAVVGMDWNGCVLRIRCVGLGGKRKKKSPSGAPRMRGKGMYGAVGAAGGAAAGVIGRAAAEAAVSAVKAVEKATRKKRVAAVNHGMARAGSLAAKMGRLVGRGDYKLAGSSTVVNSLIKGPGPNAYSSFGGDNSCCLIEHREFIGDLSTGSSTASPPTFPFSIGSIEVNPGLSLAFPWLAQIAQNYEEYCMLGLIYEFVSTTSPYNANSAMGEVIFTSQDNPTAPPYTTRSQLFNSEMSVSARLDENMMYGVECKDPAIPWYQVRSGASNTPINLCDPAKFYYATSVASTFPQNSVLGELWVTYRVMFRGPILKQAGSGTLTAVFSTVELGTTPLPSFFADAVTKSIIGTGRFSLYASKQQVFNPGTPLSPTATGNGYIRLIGANPGDVLSICASYNLILNPILTTTLPTNYNVNLPYPTYSGCQPYYVDTITQAQMSPPSVVTEFAPTVTPAGAIVTSQNAQRCFTQQFFVQVTGTNPYVQLTWPLNTQGGNTGTVSSGVWPCCAASGTYSGRSAVTYVIAWHGSYKDGVNAASAGGDPLQRYTTTPLWGDLDGDSLAVSLNSTPTLLA